VIFHEGATGQNDLGRLRFMADKTVEDADLDERGKAQMRDQRYSQIEQVAAMLKVDKCFRLAIRTYFGDTTVSRRRSLAEIILDWVFGTKEGASKAHFCCDYCDREFLKKYSFRTYVSAVLEEAK
jgi:hypothetical protein